MQKIIAVTGTHGFIGQALVKELTAQGFTVRAIPRLGGTFAWQGLTGADAIIHLAGRNIAARWSPSFKQKMLTERAAGVTSLQAALASLPNPPKTVIIASAIGFYGPCTSPATEDLPHGQGFPADICKVLEAGPYPPQTRVVFARVGVVLHASGGALAKMLPAFYLGLGGRVGSGAQTISWIARTDTARALVHLLNTQALQGPVNIVAPMPVTQMQLAQALAAHLYRPCLLPLPGFAVNLMFGEMGQALLLEPCHVSSSKLEASGFSFTHPQIKTAMAAAFTKD